MTARIAKFTYGLPSEIVYDPSDPEHVRRAHNSYVDAMGDIRVRNAFSTMLTRVRHHSHCPVFWTDPIVLQGTKVLEDREIRLPRVLVAKGAPHQQNCTGVYSGTLGNLREPTR